MRWLLLGFAWLFGLEGCLSTNYQLSHAELVRLAKRPPAQRGEQVRVLQQSALNEDRMESEYVELDESTSSETPSNIRVDFSLDHGGHHGGGYGRFGHGGLGRTHASPTRSSGAGSGGLDLSLNGGGAGDAVILAIVGVAVAGGIGVSAAAIEGSRFDGWAQVDADRPLYLVNRGASRWLPLSALTERDVAAADHAVIADRDENVLRLWRAPLERPGFVYEFELGSARLNTVSGARDLGFASRMGFGYFPWQTLGIAGGGQVAFGDARAGSSGGVVFNGRLFGELEYLPIHTGRFHAGLYTELGGALALQDLADLTRRWSGLYVSAGFLAQVDWTTRLALDVRAGIAALPAYPGGDAVERAYLPEVTLGFAVY